MDYLQYVNTLHFYISLLLSFKPYYKWITFNTLQDVINLLPQLEVLNLIINGLPSILDADASNPGVPEIEVLNLIINGLPSILLLKIVSFIIVKFCFKPYYKWITFNTNKREEIWEYIKSSFKPYYKWITFNTTPVVIRFHYISGIGF